MTTRRDLTAGIGASALLAAATPALAQAPRALTAAQLDAAVAPDGPPREIIPLWPRRPPGAPRALPVEVVLERSTPPALRDRAVTHTSRPILIAFRPAQPNGAAVLLCPGGGYQRVVLDKEGYESAEIFNAAGVTVFILVYRLPEDQWAAGPDASLQDAQRAIRIIRARAVEYSLDPQRVGVLGFSAGGHVAGSLALRFDRETYARVDAVDDQPTKPNFSMLLYPVVTMTPPSGQASSGNALIGANPSDELRRAYSLEYAARPDAPPTFILTAADDDTIPMENSLLLYDALRAAQVPTELHMFETGGHGFGIRFTVGKPTAVWPELAMAWMRAHSMMGA